MKKMKMIIAVIIALFISGCGSKVPFKVQEPLENASLVYIYVITSHGETESSSYQPFSLRINGKRLGERPRIGEYVVLNLKPDYVKFSATRDQTIEESLELNLKAGETYYLKIRDNLEKGAFAFEQVSKEVGAKEITKTSLARFIKVMRIDNLLTEIVGSDKEQEGQTVEVKREKNTQTSKVDELEKMHKLKEKGAISEEEYNTLKSQIISK